jgi:hypothetical protein
MKLYLLAECVERLSQCDIDDPNDQKTISMCESYILESYNYYLESCEENGYEPLSESEYLQNIMLNEGFFKKLLGGAALVGGAVAAGSMAKKTINSVNSNAKATGAETGGFNNFKQNASNFMQQSGGIGGAIKNIRNTSRNSEIAQQQYNGASRTRTINSNNVMGDAVMSVGDKKTAKKAVKKGKNLTGTDTIILNKKDENGNNIVVDTNSERGQRIVDGQARMQKNRANGGKKKQGKAKGQPEAPADNNTQQAAATQASTTNTQTPQLGLPGPSTSGTQQAAATQASTTNTQTPQPTQSTPTNGNGNTQQAATQTSTTNKPSATRPEKDDNGSPIIYDKNGKPLSGNVKSGTVGYRADGTPVTFKESINLMYTMPLTPAIRMPAKYR